MTNLALGHSVKTTDIAKTLQGQKGVFEAISPKGETFRIECHPNHSIVSLTNADNPNRNWEIKKVSEATSEDEQSRAAGQVG